MNPKGRVLLVGLDQALVNELTPSMVGREYETVPVADARAAALKLSSETFAALVLDFAKASADDRAALVKLQADKGGFALIGLEPAAPLTPAMAAPMRRLPWPLPRGFVDQVRAVEVPIAFLVEPTLFLTQGIQGALRQAGVQFFQVDSHVGMIEMLREQSARSEQARTKSKPAKGGFWGRLAGGSDEPSDQEPPVLGHIAVAKFTGTHAEAQQFDAKLRQVMPNAACYLLTPLDPLRAATMAITKGKPAVVPREQATRVAEVLSEALGAVKAAPREKERLLLVDNDVPTLSRLSESLIALGYDVTSTVNGEEALRLAQQKPFALVAIGGSALETTKLSGANLALKLREKDKDLRLILMIDQFPVQDALKGVTRAIELGLDDAVTKPVDASRLVLSIQRALDARFLKLENARLFKETEDLARKLAQVNGFQTKFFATVAHDVKNPLTAILGYAEVLAMRLKDKPDELKCAAHINNAAKTLNHLVSDLVDLAAIESGKLRVEIGELDLAAVIAEVKSRVDVVAERKQLKFSMKVPPGIPPLKGDAHRIGQVIQNLCTNAVQYTKEGGSVTIEATLSPDWVVVGVRDTGIGISKEDLPRVWERFFQTKEAQTMRKAGFGLGLKIAREIVQMHGGDMGIESELGVGSFFFFKLPIPKGAAAPPPAASGAASIALPTGPLVASLPPPAPPAPPK
ncbi:MAG: response regulator [Elusimicrobia bacterium]|nr:response regulator [Elusimicrobiota bacterium]